VSSVVDLLKTLAEIHSIRGHVARDGEVRAYGPTTLAATAGLALLAAAAQAHWIKDPQARYSCLSGHLGCNRLSIVSHDQPRSGHPCAEGTFGSDDGDDVLRARAVLCQPSMGIPFGVGQVLIAVVLKFGHRDTYDDP
jgi:hypothetical protein